MLVEVKMVGTLTLCPPYELAMTSRENYALTAASPGTAAKPALLA